MYYSPSVKRRVFSRNSRLASVSERQMCAVLRCCCRLKTADVSFLCAAQHTMESVVNSNFIAFVCVVRLFRLLQSHHYYYQCCHQYAPVACSLLWSNVVKNTNTVSLHRHTWFHRLWAANSWNSRNRTFVQSIRTWHDIMLCGLWMRCESYCTSCTEFALQYEKKDLSVFFQLDEWQQRQQTFAISQTQNYA